MLNRRRRPVFIHISKNAGTSIVKSARRSIVVTGHRTAASWVSENGRDAPLFAVVRNPFDRLVSEYSFRKRRFCSGEKNPHLANLNRPFDQWVRATFRDGEYRTRSFFEESKVPFNPRNMVGDTLIWFLPQRQWMVGADGEMLVDHVLRFEHLDREWASFCEKYRIRRNLRHRNRSPRDRGYRQYYSPETRAIVEDYYQEDLEAFGYRFL